jgi:hypothetical protein
MPPRKTKGSTGSSPETKKVQKQKAHTGWRAKCIAEFGLMDFEALGQDSSMLPKAVKEASEATEEIWEAYYKMRIGHKGYSVRECGEDGELAKLNDEDSDDDDEDDEDDMDDGIRKEVVRKVAKLLQADAYLPLLSLDRHTYVLGPSDTTWEDMDDLRSCDLRAIVYSPLALPRHITLDLSYHQRARYHSIEYFFSICFDLGSGSRKFAEATQAALARRWLTDTWNTPSAPFGERGEILCANAFEDPPDSGLGDEMDMQLWVQVEDIDVHNFTPATVRRIRSWLMANCAVDGSHKLLSDAALMELLLATAGTGCQHVDEGYCWPDTCGAEHDALKAQLEADGMKEYLKDGRVPPISWLSYQTRLATQTLTPLDSYYTEYDVHKARAEWGERVLEHVEEREEEGEEDEEDGDEIALLRKQPHLVWELAKERKLPWGRGRGMGGLPPEQMMMLARMMGMAR